MLSQKEKATAQWGGSIWEFGLDKVKATRSGGFEFKRLIPVALWVCQKAAAKTKKLMAKSSG
jgi:hypothetical protein